MQDLPPHKAMKTQAEVEMLEVCWWIELHCAWWYRWLLSPIVFRRWFDRSGFLGALNLHS
jgi:hypothetical protein